MSEDNGCDYAALEEPVTNHLDLKATVAEARKLQADLGVGLHQAKRLIRKDKIEGAIEAYVDDPYDPYKRRVADILRAMLALIPA